MWYFRVLFGVLKCYFCTLDYNFTIFKYSFTIFKCSVNPLMYFYIL
jgi:hypothetical protein